MEIQQLLAKYAVTITQGDIEGLLSVFTPDGTYSAFGDTYPLDHFPALVAAAPKGLFMTGTALVDLDGRPDTRRVPSRCASSSTPSTTCASATTATPTSAPTTAGG